MNSLLFNSPTRIGWCVAAMFSLSALVSPSAFSASAHIVFNTQATKAKADIVELSREKLIIRLPRDAVPSVQGIANVQRRFEGDAVLFEFSLPRDATVSVQHTPTGVAIGIDEPIRVPPSPTPSTAAALAPTGALPLRVAAAPQESGGDSAIRIGDSLKSSTPKEIKDNLSKYSLDMSVPDSPAFQLLGVSPQNVIHPTSPREFGASLLNAVRRNGKLATGLAIDTAPFLLFSGEAVTLAEYRKNNVTRLLTNTQISFASVRVDDEKEKATKYALGLHMIFFDKGDPRFDTKLTKCFEEAADTAVFGSNAPIPPDPNQAKIEIASRQKAFASEVELCRSAAKKRNWNRTSWTAGIATSLTDEPNSSSNKSTFNGSAIWTTFAYGFEGMESLEGRAQLLAHVRRYGNERIAAVDGNGPMKRKDSNLAGLRFRYGSEATAFSIEGTYSRGRFDDGKNEHLRRLAIGGEFRVAKDIWIALSAGGEGGLSDGKQSPFVLGSLKFGSSSEPVFDFAR